MPSASWVGGLGEALVLRELRAVAIAVLGRRPNGER